MIERQSGNKDKNPRVIKPKLAGQKETELHTGTATCEVCGNEYDKPLEIVVNGISHYFDSFECAIHQLAPRCEHCGCRIIGHGQEVDGRFFCCVHCAETDGVAGLKDRL